MLAIVPVSVAATDSPFPAGPPWIYPAVVATATLLPTWRALRTRPATAVTVE